MTKDEALRLALEALYGFIPYLPLEHDKPQCDRYDQAITAIKAALEAKDEPVAIVAEIYMSRYTIEWTNGDLPEGTKLYTTPPQRTWVGLMEDEAMEVALEVISRLDLPTTTKMQLEQQFLHALSNPNSLWMLFAAEIEAKLEEKNT
jgi:hypothetical protein